jgi:AcrR family transcriptional regulator
MPKNRQRIPRQQRVDELVSAATELFLSRGYGATAMSAIADSAGVANAALYWYFPTKDDLLAEVWDRALTAEIEMLKARPPGPDPFDHLLKGLADLRPYRQLHMAMHDRLGSDAVAAAHDRLIDWIRDLIRAGLEHRGHSGQDRDEIVELVVVVFEGLNVPRVDARPAADVIRTLLAYVV